MPVSVSISENTVEAALSGEIDHHNAAALRGEIDLAAEQCRPQTLILDFAGVSFMDSSGIGLVMGRYKAVKAYGGKVVVRNAPPQIKKVMRLAGLDSIAVIE